MGKLFNATGFLSTTTLRELLKKYHDQVEALLAPAGQAASPFSAAIRNGKAIPRDQDTLNAVPAVLRAQLADLLEAVDEVSARLAKEEAACVICGAPAKRVMAGNVYCAAHNQYSDTKPSEPCIVCGKPSTRIALGKPVCSDPKCYRPDQGVIGAGRA